MTRPPPKAPTPGRLPGPHPDDASVPDHQGGASGRAAVLPHGRLLRAVLRRRQARRPPDRHHAHHPRQVRRPAHRDGRRALPRRRRLPGQAGEARRDGGHLRADRRPDQVQGAGGAPGHPHRHAGHADGRVAARQPPRHAADGRRRRRRRHRAGHPGRPRLAGPRQRTLLGDGGARQGRARRRAGTAAPGGAAAQRGHGAAPGADGGARQPRAPALALRRRHRAARAVRAVRHAGSHRLRLRRARPSPSRRPVRCCSTCATRSARRCRT
jgi:hypothetical protein